MRVLGILQNQWVLAHQVKIVNEMAKKYGDAYTDLMNSYALFRGCLTGRRILAAFGEKAKKFSWTNASPIVVGTASECPPGDPEYVARIIRRMDPDVVLVFGNVAAKTVRSLPFYDPTSDHPVFIFGPHPAARKYGVTYELAEMASQLQQEENRYAEMESA